MEANTAALSASVASERESGHGRRNKVKASKDDDAIKMAADNDPQEDSAEAPSVGTRSGSKSKKGSKSVSLKKSKSFFKPKGGEGDFWNADVNAELAGRRHSLETEAHPSEKRDKNKMLGIKTVGGATKKEKGGDATVSDRSTESRTGQHPDIEKKNMRRAVEKWKKHAFKTRSRMNLYNVVQTVPSEYLARARGSEVIQPTVNGLKQFGISKGEISRVVVKFPSPPTPHPLTICFHFPSTFLTHRYVLDMIRALIQGVEGARVNSIQFVDRNTIHGARGLDNRWLVTLNMAAARDVILSQGLQLFNRRILVRRYDEILCEEYEEFLEYTQIKRRLYNKKEEDTAIAEEEELEDSVTSIETSESEQPDLSER